jgi:hypothetical protein
MVELHRRVEATVGIPVSPSTRTRTNGGVHGASITRSSNVHENLGREDSNSRPPAAPTPHELSAWFVSSGRRGEPIAEGNPV